MTGLLIVSDDQHRAYFNPTAICMFRLKKAEDGELAKPMEIEIEFMGGTKTKLHGEPAEHFLSAMNRFFSP